MQVPDWLSCVIREKEITIAEYCAENRSYSVSVHLIDVPDLHAVKSALEENGYSVLLFGRLGILVLSIDAATVHFQKTGKILVNQVLDKAHAVAVLARFVEIITALQTS